MDAPGTTMGGCGGWESLGIADTGGIWPRRLQDWRAHGPGDCRIGGHKAP